ncbi:transketolase [Sporanaerobium hydrogeniformans]|uniref:Transketolase n=1 Tax=Sporanaerobium hydrogeniformans TaxID=3072179 RepID=A0AC61DFD8_9FIRM|nr:transketolase [Sporanaerobium hydrogeniformans]PHV71237.1 transketolase [Sporanaerobium hydrogeniformans]
MSKIKEQSINTIRVLAAETVQKANSGHPGLPLGSAPMAYTLWAEHLKHNPKSPKWENRDRFILSAGHGSALLYSLLHLFGYGITIEDLKNFRQEGSLTPGHPEYGHTVGIETTTGPLGQGIATGVGMAMAEKYLATHFNKEGYDIVDHYTYALVGDGCLMEGISYEAAALAGTLELGKFIVLYDSNNITIEGNTDIAFRENVRARFEAQGFETFLVEDGNDIEAIGAALKAAKANQTKPSLIEIRTQIGYGCPAKQGKAAAHGEPLGIDNIKEMRTFLGHHEEEFFVDEEVKTHMESIIQKGVAEEAKWNALFENYAKAYPELASEWKSWHADEEVSLEELYAKYADPAGKKATRVASFEVINEMVKAVPNVLGGSADLAPSTKTYMNGKGDFSAEDYTGQNLHFGIREHAMGAIANGIRVHGGLKTFCSTFFVFSDYMKNPMRLAALMKLPVIYVLTHDSIGVGEDGPTHQPIEQLAMLRSTPNMVTFRPADAKETVAAWEYALNSKTEPVAIVLSRQDLPYLEKTGAEAKKGAYAVAGCEPKDADIILIGTGSEVQLAVEAVKELEKEGVKAAAISMASMDVFEEQSQTYKESILPPHKTKRVAIEAAASFGWHKYTGFEGRVIALDTFGESAPAGVIFEKKGFTVANVVKVAKEVLA